MSSIRIEQPETEGRTLRTAVSPSRELCRFFSGEPLEVTYDSSIADVPEPILVIPALAQVAPVAWANGADIYVDTLDRTFASALEPIGKTFVEMYDFMQGGTVSVGKAVDASPGDIVRTDTRCESSRAGLLFTGGVDSTSSLVRHREKQPTLISIRGWTIKSGAADDEQWRHVVERTNRFAAEFDLDTAFIEANMLSFVDHPMLLAHYKRYVDGSWYSSVGHGLGLLGLCAPLAFARGFEDIYIGATHWDGIDLEWGSRPDIDDNVRWSGTNCHHTNYDRTRQERLDLIAEFLEANGSTFPLHTCNVLEDRNCSECEKCYRTAVGLRLAGLDPEQHGYEFSEEAYTDIQEAFENGRWVLGHDERYMWEDIRDRTERVEPQSEDEAAFFEWLQTVDFSEIVDTSVPPLHHRLIRAGARHTPNPVYRRAYPAWSLAKSSYQQLVSRVP